MAQSNKITCLNIFPQLDSIVVERGIGFMEGKRYKNITAATLNRISHLTHNDDFNTKAIIHREDVALFIEPN